MPSPGDLSNPGIKPRSPALQLDSLLSEPLGKPPGVALGYGKDLGGFSLSSVNSLSETRIRRQGENQSCQLSLSQQDFTMYFTISVVPDQVKIHGEDRL